VILAAAYISSPYLPLLALLPVLQPKRSDVKMRLHTTVALCLLAGAVSHALPQAPTAPSEDSEATTLPTEASTDPTVASSQLNDLAEFAQTQANKSLSDSSTKRSSCNIYNVAVRKEW